MTHYDAHRLPLRALFMLLARVRCDGLESFPRSGAAVVVCNHLTDLDPFVLGVLVPRPLRFMAKEELFRWAPLGWWLRQAGTFPVRRDGTDREALRHAEHLLQAGEIVMIFPEGHRSQGGGLQAARAGAVLLASRAHCPIIPVAISGTERIRLAPVSAALHTVGRPPRVQVRFGAPITVQSLAHGRARRDASDRIMRAIVEMLPRAYHGVYAQEEPRR